MAALRGRGTEPHNPSYNRGDIWMVDFGNPAGTELGPVHPAVIVSRQEFNNFAIQLGRVIVVPGTSTHSTNANGQTIMPHLQVNATLSNGLKHTTYFMTEQVCSVSLIRFRRLLGSINGQQLSNLEDRLCMVLDLFK
jgi:mRNA interferase MazF